ncbi:hypothetical protein SAMN06296036_10867 [Pseudobacteriovorax antillogorgiicola]|uniref:Uncharacterized protein n=1 Tax=Pseudobacteriovorax antillogorgiicola TaxID=1513793 RepID=A0A1Y6BSA5_9BACT|nr:hypothetical protein EDD56_108179 [Pseudobacteriovorax antillogorgiicola]SMF25402.1 hypothetical protein SAMN06296036_10867 [Pseudobacteriovorax antillogorgiicola]
MINPKYPKRWPHEYGLHQEQISEKFMKQLFYPFFYQLSWRRRKRALK